MKRYFSSTCYLMLAIALATAALQVEAGSGGTTWTDLTDGTEIAGNLTYTSVRIPAGATVWFTDDTLITATNVLVEGSLRGQTPGSTGSDAPSLTIRATQSLRIDGLVRAAAGAAGAAATSASEAVGGSGGRGGHIILENSGSDGVYVGAAAEVISGPGGNGGSATVHDVLDSPSTLTARGGAGASGGDLGIVSSRADLLGVMRVGNGGHGGDAVANATGRNVETFGGNGGNPGALALPPGVSVETLVQAGILTGGAGGDGGVGSSSAHGQDEEVTGEFGGRGCDGQLYGGDACTSSPKGGYARARGGHGGPDCAAPTQQGFSCVALSGGNGGKAMAWGGLGGFGGYGAPGDLASTTNPISGGRGGNGGEGGDAEARGGNRGCATVSILALPAPCGEYGFAETATYEGWGGGGGNGGYARQLTSEIWSHCTTARPYSCWETTVEGQYYVCGHAGTGGYPGTYGSLYSESYGGADYERYYRYDGNYGYNGNYPWMCDHSRSHSHI